MKNFRETFCLRLRELRGSENQTNFAKAIGLRQTTYSNFERGTREPGLQIVGEIATRFGVSVDWLLGLDSHSRTTSVVATGASVAANNSTVTTGGGIRDRAERARLIGIIESQQRTIETMAARRGNQK